MLNHGGHNIAEEICEVLASRGYVCGYTLLNSAFYGVPQMRERMFLVALHRSLNEDVQFPAPTHRISLPPGYESSRLVALKHLEAFATKTGRAHFHPASKPRSSHPAAVTARQALGDLPAIHARSLLASGTLKRGARITSRYLMLRQSGQMLSSGKCGIGQGLRGHRSCSIT
jgi:DNA (cytosine-5)-methyltransferase 1